MQRGPLCYVPTGSIPTGRDVTPALTTVHVPLDEVGYQTLKAAIDHDWRPVEFTLDVVERASTPARTV